jgi:hypothetical protein
LVRKLTPRLKSEQPHINRLVYAWAGNTTASTMGPEQFLGRLMPDTMAPPPARRVFMAARRLINSDLLLFFVMFILHQE